MEIILHRKVFNANSCEGNLYVDGKWFCSTIEDKVRAAPGQWHKSLKIVHETAIPYGRYPVMVTWSNRFKRQLTGVFNVPDFDGIRIHNGTNDKSSSGCVIVSYKDNDKAHTLINDKAAMNDLCNLVEEKQKTEKVWLTITDTYI